jgi:hypothetical protein
MLYITHPYTHWKGNEMSKKFFLTILAVIAAGLLFSACGGSNYDHNSTTTVKGEVISVETSIDLYRRGILVLRGPYYISIKDGDEKIHKIAVWKIADLNDTKLVPGSTIKVRYKNNSVYYGDERIYDEDGLYLRNELTQKWHTIEAMTVLDVPAVPVERSISARRMEVGTYGYAVVEPGFILAKNNSRCIGGGTIVKPEKLVFHLRGPNKSVNLLDVYDIMAKIERQSDGFHISLVSQEVLGLNDEEPRAVLPLC